jgi:hypothetical protein
MPVAYDLDSDELTVAVRDAAPARMQVPLADDPSGELLTRRFRFAVHDTRRLRGHPPRPVSSQTQHALGEGTNSASGSSISGGIFRGLTAGKKLG